MEFHNYVRSCVRVKRGANKSAVIPTRRRVTWKGGRWRLANFLSSSFISVEHLCIVLVNDTPMRGKSVDRRPEPTPASHVWSRLVCTELLTLRHASALFSAYLGCTVHAVIKPTKIYNISLSNNTTRFLVSTH